MKTFKQFQENLEARETVSKERNIVHSLGRPGHQAPGYSYAGKRAPDRNNPGKEVPQETRRAQDLRAAQVRSRQRQGL